jgi:hypothetical protein
LLRFRVRSDYHGVLRALHASIKESRGHLEFYSPSKGIIVFTKPWYSWFGALSMLVEIERAPFGCSVSLTSFYAGYPFRQVWITRRYERKFGERFERNLT